MFTLHLTTPGSSVHFLKFGDGGRRRIDFFFFFLPSLSKWLCYVIFLVFNECSLFVINSSLVFGNRPWVQEMSDLAKSLASSLTLASKNNASCF